MVDTIVELSDRLQALREQHNPTEKAALLQWVQSNGLTSLKPQLMTFLDSAEVKGSFLEAKEPLIFGIQKSAKVTYQVILPPPRAPLIFTEKLSPGTTVLQTRGYYAPAVGATAANQVSVSIANEELADTADLYKEWMRLSKGRPDAKIIIQKK